jgi:hypothetical protein
MIAFATLALAPHALANGPPLPVLVYSIGPEAVRVRVAAGAVLPCSSSSNTELFEGPIEPGQLLTITTPASVVCIQQTYEGFPDTDWSIGRVIQRPAFCTPTGCLRRRPIRGDQAIRVELSSRAS